MSEPRRFIEDDQTAKQYILEVSPDITRDFASNKHREINILLKANLISNLNMEFKVSLHVLCDLLSEMIQYDKALLYLWDNDLELMNPYIVRGVSGKLPKHFQQGNLFAEWCMRYGKTFYIPFGRHPEVTHLLEELNTKCMISAPIYESNNIIGTMELFSEQPNFFSEEDAKLLWLLMIQCEGLFRNYEQVGGERAFGPLERSAGQTNLPQFYDQLEREIGRADRRKTPMSLLLIEIDHLADYTRRFGHLKAEQVLSEIGSVLMNQVRQIDMACRYGENRFALLLTETDRKGGLVFADRLRETISRHLFQDERGERSITLTISAGLVTFPFDAKEKMSLIQAVEEALHRAKEMGGNQVNLYPSADQESRATGEHAPYLDPDRVTQTIHSIFNLDRLFELVVQIAMETLEAEKGSLLLYDSRSGQFIIRVASGFGKYAELIRNTRVPVDNTITGWVMGLKQPLVSENIEEIREIPKSLYKDYKTKSFLSIPLILRDETLGVMHLSNKTANQGVFTEKDLERIQPLSGHLTHFLSEGIAFEERQRNFSKTALSYLAMMLEARDPYCRDHSEKVARIAKDVAARLNMGKREVEQITLSARLHDIGKIAIQEQLFQKPEKLNEDEIATVRRLPFFSWKILDALSTDDEDVKNTVLKVHEKLNGSGYPYGLVGEQIPMSSRVLLVADTFVAMTSNRSFRPPFTKDEALENMKSLANVYYDPEVLQKLSEII